MRRSRQSSRHCMHNADRGGEPMTKTNEPVGGGAPTEPEVTTVFAQNSTKLPQNTTAANSPVISGVRRGPGGKAAWLVSIEGICTDTPFWDRKLRRSRRFCNI